MLLTVTRPLEEVASAVQGMRHLDTLDVISIQEMHAQLVA